MDGFTLKELEKLLKTAMAKVEKTSEARFLLPHGSSRAKVTTANARWIAACKHRNRIMDAIAKATA